LQRLAFARLLLHKPSWVCVDEALDSLEQDVRETLLTIFDNELAGACVLSLGRRDLREGFSTRSLRLIKTPEPELTSTIQPHQPRQMATPAVSTL
jgi:vitamin B12/bleomycin/antimicrobial peptide transport system ATP-binding/permease protein